MTQKLLRLRAVEDWTGLSRAVIYRMMKAGEFPRPIQLTGARAVAWLSEDVDGWIKTRIAESRGGVSQ
jgi:prophage regulatory protein